MFLQYPCIQVLNNKETEMLLSLPPDRIGHGTYLLPSRGGNQEFVDNVFKHKTPIGFLPCIKIVVNYLTTEMCLTSNVKGRTVASYSEHHFSYWHKQDHPIVVCVSVNSECTIVYDPFYLDR